MFPIDSIQALINPWWEKSESKTIDRGSLVYAFLPHVDQVPYTIKPVARKKDDEHEQAEIDVAPLRMQDRLSKEALPVAAMTISDKELWCSYVAKKRPCLVLGSHAPAVDNSLRRGMPKRNTAPVVLVAPYYGADQDWARAGYNPPLVERIRHAEYRQFFMDMLPIPGSKESILRFDHMQPVGTHYNSYELSGYKLSPSALEVMEHWLHWLLSGGVPADSNIITFRSLIDEFLDHSPSPP